ncbi:MAG: bifunctional adenosylcobinamide kinase/adenosylcobinamide-phosphate guanylyltransferase [Vulcanococcus sp.]
MAVEGLVLVCGGSRSGKSRWAEHLAASSGKPVLYVATAALRPEDPSWCERLDRHRQRRPSSWGCLEVEGGLSEALQELQRPGHPQGDHLLLIDALGTWLAHHLDADPARWQHLQQELLAALASHRAPILLVCEEVGLGVVPPTAIGNRFRDRLGELNQRLMTQSQDSWLVVAGRALNLHALAVPVPET